MPVAPYNISELNRVPYLSDTELLNSATASAIDWSNLIANGGERAQQRARAELIVRASAKVDNYCFGAFGTLCATENTENGRYRANRNGEIIIHPYFNPLLEVKTFTAGVGPQSMTPMMLSDANCWIERDQFVIVPTTGLGTAVGPLSIVAPSYGTGRQLFCEYTYVNGFANTFLTANAAAGVTSITVTSGVGIYPSQPMTIWDGINDENVQVASTYDGVSLTIPLTSATKYAHGENTNFSAIPATVKQATIHFVVGMVKERGQGGLVLNEIGEPMSASNSTVTNYAEDDMARDLLHPYRQIWGRS